MYYSEFSDSIITRWRNETAPDPRPEESDDERLVTDVVSLSYFPVTFLLLFLI